MNFQQFATTEFGTKLWMALGRRLPPRAGHALAKVVTGILSRRRDSALYRTLYANQAGVLGPEASPEQLHAAVRAVLRHAGFVSFDLMHVVGQGEDAIRDGVIWEPEVWENIKAAQAFGRGLVICSCHLSNFNLALLSFALRDVPMQVLSVAAPAGGFQLMFELRSRGVLEETPIDGAALRQAIQRLRCGGAVATAVDWPVAVSTDEMVPFFGRPAHLPTGHVRLAMQTGALLLFIACRWAPGRGYVVRVTPPLELELTGDRAFDVRHNAGRMLAICEEWIADAPDQWLMYHPVWEEQ